VVEHGVDLAALHRGELETHEPSTAVDPVAAVLGERGTRLDRDVAVTDPLEELIGPGRYLDEDVGVDLHPTVGVVAAVEPDRPVPGVLTADVQDVVDRRGVGVPVVVPTRPLLGHRGRSGGRPGLSATAS
jgi:hypothetical protein